MDFLPEVRMDLTPNNSDDEELIEDREAIELKEDIDDFNPDKDIDVNDISNNEVIKKEKLPKPKKTKQDIDVQDIFNMPNSTAIDKTKPNDNIKLTKKGKPRKQRPPMTEEHKEKLKKAREKAMLVRKQKAQERRSAKALDVEEKQLIQKQKQKRVSKLKKEVEEDIDMNDEPPTRKTSETWITKKDLEEAQFQAIMSYEKMRKERKAEKQVRQKKEKEEEMVRQQIRRAVAPPQKEYNPFDICY